MRGSPFVFSLCLGVACSGQPSSSTSPSDAEPVAQTNPSPAPSTETATEPAAEPAAEPTDNHAAPSPAAPDTVATVGQPAPDFTLTDIDGRAHRLSSYRGSVVVLEWFNPKCPFVKFAHEKGPLQDMAKTQTQQGVIWLAINSGGPGRQGHGEKATRKGVERYGMEHPVLLDEDGSIGHLYGATKTPQVFLIDAEGVVQYGGAIDNAPFGEVDGDVPHRNHLAAALDELRGGEPISMPETPSYGCTVKYARG